MTISFILRVFCLITSVIFLSMVIEIKLTTYREPEQSRAEVRLHGEAETREHSATSGLDIIEVGEEGGDPGPAQPLVVGVPVIHVDLNLASEAIIDHVVFI